MDLGEHFQLHPVLYWAPKVQRFQPETLGLIARCEAVSSLYAKPGSALVSTQERGQVACQRTFAKLGKPGFKKREQFPGNQNGTNRIVRAKSRAGDIRRCHKAVRSPKSDSLRVFLSSARSHASSRQKGWTLPGQKPELRALRLNRRRGSKTDR